MRDGVRLALHDLGGTGPTVLFVHAASLCASMFGPLSRELAPEYHCIAPDLRGHGRSDHAKGGDLSWQLLADDVAQVIDQVPPPVLGFGHSLGATLLMLAAADRPELVAAVVGYEPVVLTSEAASKYAEAHADRSGRRRTSFSGPDELRERLSGRPPMNRLEADALEGYLKDAFRTTPDGRLELVLSPRDEASLYRAGIGADLSMRLSDLACPVTIITGGDSPDAREIGTGHLLDLLSHAEGITLEGCGHYGPLEASSRVAEVVRRAFATALR